MNKKQYIYIFIMKRTSAQIMSCLPQSKRAVRVLLRCSASASCVAPASPIWFAVNNVISKSKHHNTLNYTKAIQMKKMKTEIKADMTWVHFRACQKLH